MIVTLYVSITLFSNVRNLQAISRLMKRDMPAVPKMSFAIVDVRDVAAAHIAGLTAPNAAGITICICKTVLGNY